MHLPRIRISAALYFGLAFGLSQPVLGDNDYRQRDDHGEQSFQRIATLPNYINNADRADETVSEIVSATRDGKLLVYSDAELGTIGLVNIKDPYNPVSAGTIELDGSPTSVSVLDNRLALVGVDETQDLDNPAGELLVVDLKQRRVVRRFALGGQPDAIAISPDGKYAAIAIENQRDEDEFVDGVEGDLPQPPPGSLIIVDIKSSNPMNWSLREVDLTGVGVGYFPEDPETEFVDINDHNQAVLTLQENNSVLVVDLPSGQVVSAFDAGMVTLDNVDAVEDGVIELADTIKDIRREPDAVAWIPTGKHNRRGRLNSEQAEAFVIATANEGDLVGGSRGFTIFDQAGNVRFDSGNSFEHLAVRIGHYPEDRSENKGSEPESIEFANFGDDGFLFVGSERGSFVAVYQMDGDQPRLKQVLPGPLAPEGVLAIPQRNLLVVSGESDDPEFGVRSSIMIYKLQPGEASYPQILSANDSDGLPIPWSAMSGMTALTGNKLLAVWDSYYSESRIFTIDVSRKPARVTKAITIQGGSGNFDPEGIDVAPDGTYWIASEGNASGSRKNRLLQTETDGTVLKEIFLPDEIEACRAESANSRTLGSGFEGVAVMPTRNGYRLLVAQQRGWDYTSANCEDLDDDDGGLNANGEPLRTRIWIYDPNSGAWDHIAWELAPLPALASWVGLSEITRHGNAYVVIERDNRTGDFTELKTLVGVRASAGRDGIISQNEKRIVDLIPQLLRSNGWISDKPEGTAITRDGRVYLITDNDGVEDWSGETQFLRLGTVWNLFY